MNNNNKGQIVIGLTGYAQVGKDTFFKLLKEMLPNKVVTRYAFADELKKEVSSLKDHYGFDFDWNNCEFKNRTRSLLVWWATERRRQDADYWVKKLQKSFLEDTISDIKVITDNRYENESKWIKSFDNSSIISISRFNLPKKLDGTKKIEYIEAANEEEAQNQPRATEMASYRLEWPTLEDSSYINSLKMYVSFFIKELKLNGQ